MLRLRQATTSSRWVLAVWAISAGSALAQNGAANPPAAAASEPKTTIVETLLTGDKLILRSTADGFKALIGTQPPPPRSGPTKPQEKAQAPSSGAAAAVPAEASAKSAAQSAKSAAESAESAKAAEASAQAASASATNAVVSANIAADAAAAAAKSESAAATSAAAASAGGYVAPSRTKLKVTGDLPDGNLLVVVDDTPCKEDGTGVYISSAIASTLSTIAASDAACRYANQVQVGQAYQVSKSRLGQFGYSRLGFTYGAIAIPYKYYHHDKSLETAVTAGPFIGYRFGQTGVSLSVIASYGLSSLKVSTTKTKSDGSPELGDDGKPIVESQTVMGISRSIGFMFDLAKSQDPFRLGVMWGKDRIGSNSTLKDPHQGHSWMAVQIGWEWGRAAP